MVMLEGTGGVSPNYSIHISVVVANCLVGLRLKLALTKKSLIITMIMIIHTRKQLHLAAPSITGSYILDLFDNRCNISCLDEF